MIISVVIVIIIVVIFSIVIIITKRSLRCPCKCKKYPFGSNLQVAAVFKTTTGSCFVQVVKLGAVDYTHFFC